MPLHIQEIAQDHEQEVTQWIFNQIHHAKASYISEDETHILLETELIDQISHEAIGKIVYTSRNEDKPKLLDIDIALKNENQISLDFVEKLPKSSEPNEYYLAEPKNGCRFLLETVDRYCVEKEILDTKQEVSLSLFPFQMEFFENMEEVNQAFGIQENEIFRIDEHFINPMSLFEKPDETYSFLIGKVLNYKPVVLNIDNREFKFVIAYLDTGIGIVPAALNQYVLDSNILQKDKYIVMRTDVKADFASSNMETV